MLMPTGTEGQRREDLSFASRLAITLAPALLKPMRLINALCVGKRKQRGLGFPGWASAVTVPASMKPNPIAAHAPRAEAFLSIPAPSPTRLGKFSPKSRTGS